MAALGREVAMPALVVALIAAYGSAGLINHTAASPMVQRLAPPPSVVKLAEKFPPIALGAADVAPVATVAAPVVAKPAAEVTTVAALQDPEPIVTAALPEPSKLSQPETPPGPAPNIMLATADPGDVQVAVPAEVSHECLDACVDQYLWSLYQRTPKEDSVKTQDKKQVTVKKKGKLVTVTRTVTALADEDFAWKDPKAAETAGMPLADYVIGGMDREFKLKLFHLLQAADDAGMTPGITSAFRDDYRQSIASGLKAANNRSYHGGSLRGGYGHGLAADLVSVHGATRAERLNASQAFWGWIDKHGKEFGIARPYLGRDPPHVAPIDGLEIANSPAGDEAQASGNCGSARQRRRFRSWGGETHQTRKALNFSKLRSAHV